MNEPRQSEAPRRMVVGIDPGTSKCGIAVVQGGEPQTTLAMRVVATENLLVALADVLRLFPQVDTVVMGDGTQSSTLRKAVVAMFPHLQIAVVDEYGSSRRARLRYVCEHPPIGWRRIVPIGLRTPDQPYDDLVADILARDFLNGAAKFLKQTPERLV